MKNRKINLDRPPLEQSEIQAGMNFGQLMASYQVMSKPFYKSKWFFGTTGLASIGLIVGGTVAFQGQDQAVELRTSQDLLTDSAPAQLNETNLSNEIPVIEFKPEIELPEISDQEKKSNHKKVKDDDKINTPSLPSDETLISKDNTSDENIQDQKVADNAMKKGFDPIDLTPRIGGKVNEYITREELFDNKGLTTNVDISIIHFELHLIDGLGGKVFEEESNQLNADMKAALHNVDKGETIYFENIKGKTPEGHIVKLNPLRYVLLN